MKLPAEALAHAESEYPRESCGLIVDGRYLPCRNIAATPSEHFILCPSDLKAAMAAGEVQAVVHSHPDYPSALSDADRAMAEETELPWAVVEVREGKAVDETWYEPCGWLAPLVGRPFAHGVHDCLTIILDYYQRERGIDLGHFDRADDWWNNGGDLYRHHLPRVGFYRLPEGAQPQTGDVILMQVRAPVPNHAGVFIADGLLASEPGLHPVPDCLLHHMMGQLSRRVPYGGYYREKTVGIWRYGKN